MIIYKQDFSVVTGKIKHEISSTATEGRSQQHRVSYIGRYCDGSRWRDWEGRRHDLGRAARVGGGGRALGGWGSTRDGWSAVHWAAV
jgi:hypothetical protein